MLSSALAVAVLSRDQGNHDAALPLWVKSSLLGTADGFAWNQRGWAYLALERPKESKESFLKAIEAAPGVPALAEDSHFARRVRWPAT